MQHTVSLAPDLGIAHFYFSYALFYQKEPQFALESYNKAVTLNTDLKEKNIWYWIEIQQKLCEPLIKSKEYDKAIAFYQNFLKEVEADESLSPGGMKYCKREVYVLMGEIYRQSKEYNKALAIYQAMLKEAEDDESFSPSYIKYLKYRGYAWMADIYREDGNLDKAIEFYEKSLEMVEKWKTAYGIRRYHWECTPIHKKLARVYKEKGEPQKAFFYQNRADELERKSRIITSYWIARGTTMTIGLTQFLFVLAVIVVTGVHFMIVKRRNAPQNTSSQKVSWNLKNIYTSYVKPFFFPSETVLWGMKDVCGIYLVSFFFSVVLSIPIYMIIMSFDLNPWNFSFIPNCIILFLLGVLSLFIYWRSSITRFQGKFKKVFPDTRWTPSGRSHSMILLSLWQLLCIGVINIFLIFLTYFAVVKYLWFTM